MDSKPATDYYLAMADLAKAQIGLLKKQKNFMSLQKKDLIENRKDREIIKNFTFVLAFVVIAAITFYLYQAFAGFYSAETTRFMILSSIFVFIFLLYALFIFHVFSLGSRIVSFVKSNTVGTILILIFLIILIILLLIVPNNPLP